MTYNSSELTPANTYSYNTYKMED